MGEKHHELTRGLRLFGGLIYLPMYAYYDGLTCAQVELLTMDSPVIDYNADKKKEKKKNKRPTQSDVDSAKDKWLKKYGGKKDKSVMFDLTKYE